jgi:peptide/nickel transport system permease protein
MGNSVASVGLATALINLPFYIRLSRAEVAVRRSARYVAAARLAGWRDTRILCRILLPNILPVLIVQMTMNLGWAMLNGAGLSFLGLGIRPPTAEWGVLVGEGARYMISGQWWLATFPAIALCVTMLTLTLAGDRLRDHFDPRRR